MFVIAQDTTFSGPEKLVRRWFEGWHGPDRALGGIAVFGCPLPGVAGGRGRRVDALVLTPALCTVVEIAALRRPQSGTLDTGTRWRIGSAPADLDIPVTTPDPAVRAAQAATALRARLHRAGLPDTVAELAVLVTAPGSAVVHPEPGDVTAPAVLVAGSADHGALERHFRRHSARPVCWDVATIERAFTELGLTDLLPDRDTLRREGFGLGDEPPREAGVPVAPAPGVAADAEVPPANTAGTGPERADDGPRPARSTDAGPAPHGEHRLTTDAAPPVPPALEAEPRVPAMAAAGTGHVPHRDVDRPPWLAPIPPLPERPREPRSALPLIAPGSAREIPDGPARPHPPERAALRANVDAALPHPDEPASARLDELEVEARPDRPGAWQHERPDDDDRPAGRRAAAPEPDAPERATTEPDVPRGSHSARLAAAAAVAAAATAGRPAARGVRLTKPRPAQSLPEPDDRPAPPLPRREFTEHSGTRRLRAASVPPPAQAPPRRFAPGPEPQPLRRVRHYSPPPSRVDRLKAALRRDDRPSLTMSGTAALAVLALLVGGFFVVVHTARANQPALGDYAAMCERPRGFDAAADPAPGPVGVYAAGDLNPLLTGSDPGLRRANFADEVQWVVCAARTGTGEPVQTCRYPDGSTLSLVPATYRLEVFEASTGRSVHTTTVPGDWFAPGTVAFTDRCAGAAGTAEDQPDRRIARPAPDRLHDFLTEALRLRPLPS